MPCSRSHLHRGRKQVRDIMGTTNPRLFLVSILNWTQACLLAGIIFSAHLWLAVICGHGNYSFDNIHFHRRIWTFPGDLMKNSSPMLSLHHYSIIPKPLNNHNQAARPTSEVRFLTQTSCPAPDSSQRVRAFTPRECVKWNKRLRVHYQECAQLMYSWTVPWLKAGAPHFVPDSKWLEATKAIRLWFGRLKKEKKKKKRFGDLPHFVRWAMQVWDL